MTIYAYINDGIVAELIAPLVNDEGDEIPISDRYTPEFVAQCVDVSNIIPPVQSNDVATVTNGEWVFQAYVPPAPTSEEIVATNSRHRDSLLSAASLAIAPLQDAVDLDEASADEKALLTQWKQFRVAVNRIDLTLAAPDWPLPPRPINYATTSGPDSESDA